MLNLFTVDANDSKQDGKPCRSCHCELPIITKETDKRKIIDRSNRVDCESKAGAIETYCIKCWRKAVFGKDYVAK